MKKIIISLAVLVLLTLVMVKSNVGVKADSYIYDFWKNIIPSTEGITYKETYYSKDIAKVDDPNVTIPKFSSLEDMEVHEETVNIGGQDVTVSKIYLLDLNKDDTTITLRDAEHNLTDYKVANVSKLIVINQDFKYETILNEFLITDEVKAKLDSFYHFDTPLDEISIEQFTATEFVNTYEAVRDIKTISGSKATFDLNYDPSVNKIEVIYKGKSVDEATYTATANADGKLEITFNNIADGNEVVGVVKTLKSIGRAPYLPYSLDETKAAVRLDEAQGITVTDKGIYIADTGNARILKLDKDFKVVDVYLTPADSVFYQMYNSDYMTDYGTAYEVIKDTTNMYTLTTSGYTFQPKKIAVTDSGVLYCISANVYEGLIEFSVDTSFNRFLGKNTVTADALKIFLSNFYTEEQLAKFALSLPSMFNNLAVSPDGYLYATSDPASGQSATAATNMVKVINTKGLDIMKRNGYVKPDGDAVYLQTSNQEGVVIGSSVLTSVGISKSGNFTVSDKTRGRLFTYDNEGNLLYITGEQPGGTATAGKGNGLSNSIVNPVALDYLYRYDTSDPTKTPEETVIVLDTASSSIILYETTEFGNAVNNATRLYQDGVITDTYQYDADGNIVYDENGNPVVLEMGAESYWRKVIKMNTNYELAYLGIGKALHRRDQNKEAMRYFELAHNALYYSKAFEKYRDQVLNENFNLIMTVVVVFVVGIAVSAISKQIIKNMHKEKKEGGNE